MRIFFDMETIPGQSDWIRADLTEDLERQIAELKPPGNYKKAESIEAWINAETAKLRASSDDAYRRCALDGGRGEIISIAWTVNDEPAQCLCRGPEMDAISEDALISEFFDRLTGGVSERLSGAQWVGHNIAEFDLPFLYKRCVVNKIRPPAYVPFDAKPWDRAIYDTMKQWAGKNRISQDKLCRILGLPGKPEGMDGSKVYDAWLNSDMDLIEAYNIADVEAVRAIYNRMTFLEAL